MKLHCVSILFLALLVCLVDVKAAPTDDLNEASRQMSKLGLENPSAGQYKEVSVKVGYIWGGDGVVTTHGWVMPSGNVICWSGQSYNAKSVGHSADVDKDVEELIAVCEKERTRKPTSEMGASSIHWRDATRSEASFVDYKSDAAIKVSLLTLIGKQQLASKLWFELKGRPSDQDPVKLSPYKAFADEWLWSLFDRALCAHMRGDDSTSLRCAKMCEKARAQRSSDQEKDLKQQISYLEPTLSLLIADEKRRTESATASATIGSESKLSLMELITRLLGMKFGSRSEAKPLLKQLIARLDDTRGHQFSQPGGYLFDPDPIAALASFGNDAIEPLTECLENDNRLTRVVSFGRDFWRPRALIPVADVARSAINKILNTPLIQSSLATPGERHEAANQVRAYWSKFHASPMQDRWYKILADEHETQEHWLEAAEHIVLSTDVTASNAAESPGNYVLDGQTAADLSALKTKHLAGDSLRDRKNPAVSDLLFRRALHLLQSDDSFTQQNGMHFVFALARWDGKSSLANLQKVSRMIMDGAIGQEGEVGINSQFSNGDESWMTTLEQLCETRLALGDHTAVTDYVASIKRVTPDSVHTADPFAMFWRHYDIAEIKSTAELLFHGEGSRWNPTNNPSAPGLKSVLWTSAMLAIPTYRKLIISLLQSNSVIGSIIISAKGDVMTQSKISELSGNGYNIHEPHGSFGYYSSDGKLPFHPQSKTIYRLKDAVAQQLSSVYGFPDFRAHWRLVDKDAAANRCIHTLEQYGPAITRALSGPNWDSMEQGVFSRAKFSFPRLEHPATQAEVAKGDALFSISEAGTKRVVALKEVPISAQTLVGSPKHPKEESVADLEVWQAEQVQTPQGKTLYYGVVGAHFMGRMPAKNVKLLN